MITTPAIEHKWQSLQAAGFSLGDKVGLEQDAGLGGRCQEYEHGRIYWHEQVGAHEVHGPILDRYMELGGSGTNPATGYRELGFPTTDQDLGEDGICPVSHFEGGAIYWVSGAGAVYIYGDFYQSWRTAGGETGEWGYPVSDPVSVAGGTAVYFQRGCMWKSPATRGRLLNCRFYPPLLGRPALSNPTEEIRFTDILVWELPEGMDQAIGSMQPGSLEQVWTTLGLRPVRASDSASAPADIPLFASRNPQSEQGSAGITLSAEAGAPSDRTLYNITIMLPGGLSYDLAPHAVYMKESWENFGIIHATDLHLSRRVDDFRRRLRALGLEEAAEKYNCFNDNFRDMVRYANHLHATGKADVILVTGDVTDYIFEKDDNTAGGGNFYLFEQLVRGLWTTPDGGECEELTLPVFTILGNHDYRPNGYDLLTDLDLGDEGRWDWWPDWLYTPAKTRNINGYGAHNLTEEEALALQGGQKERLDTKTAYEVIRVDPASLKYYHERINDKLSYLTEFGKHRVIMIDSRWEVGIVEGTFHDYLRFALRSFDEDARNWLAQHPNCLGFEDSELDLVRQTLATADPDALVIVGVHAPPINPSGDEWPHYFRETEHASADTNEIQGYLVRRDPKAFQSQERWQAPPDPSAVYPDWIRTGTPFFKQGSIEDLLDYGIARGSTEAFLEMCVGHGTPRKVDLVMCGHIHSNVEYRLEWDLSKRFLFYTDFYTENPEMYYPSLSNLDPVTREPRAAGDVTRLQIYVKEGAPVGATSQPLANGHARLEIPPYKDPLNLAQDPRGWWESHRPLVMQTASLGSMDRNQREELPSPSFQGFRVITIENDVITKMRYVTMRELRRNDFIMPWEQ
jgi:3',5'-cyclic AMP phosphodiesterase CpdA